MTKTRKRITFLSLGIAILSGIVLTNNFPAQKARAASSDWVQISSLSEIVSGSKYALTNSGKFLVPGAYASSNPIAQTFDVNTAIGTNAWTFQTTGTSNQWRITDGINWLKIETDSTSGLRTTTTQPTSYFNASGSGTAIKFATSSTGSRCPAYYSTNNDWRAYTTGNATTALTLYKFVGAAKTLSSIAVTTGPTTTAYFEGQTFNPAGMVITATYSDSSTANVTSSCTYSPSTLVLGTTEIVASYTEGTTKTATISGITVSARVLQSIAVTTQPTKTSYWVGETLNLSGLVVTGTYNAGTPADVTGSCTFSPSAGYAFVLGDVGSKTITVSLAPAADITFSVTVQYLSPSTTVIISEVFGGGGNSGASYNYDFIEIYNLTTAPIEMLDWSVQYASSTGSSWQVSVFSATIPAHGFLLIREATGGEANGSVLPTPDVIVTTNAINMSGTNGKVALVNSSTALSVSSPVGGASVVDFVGFGSANAYEGGSPAPAGSNTNSIQRASLTDTSSNGTDFVAATPNPKNTLIGFSEYFISSTDSNPVCDSSDWGAIADNFAVLTASVKTSFKTDTNPTVVSARERYSYLLSVNSNLTDFALLNSSSVSNIGSLESDSSMLLIIIVAGLGLTSVLAYTLGKKKEEQA